MDNASVTVHMLLVGKVSLEDNRHRSNIIGKYPFLPNVDKMEREE